MERLRVELRGERFYLSFFNYVSAGRKSLADLQIVQIDSCVVHMLLMLFTHHVTLTSVLQIDAIEPIETGRCGSSFRAGGSSSSVPLKRCHVRCCDILRIN